MKNFTLRTILVAGLAVPAAVAAAEGPADPSRAYQAELSADAVARTQNMEKAKGFFIEDGENKLRISGFAQFRYYLNFRDNPSNTSSEHDSGFTNGFEMTRSRLIATGNVLDPSLKFKIEGEFSRSTGDFGLLDAWGSYSFENKGLEGFEIKWGQFKPPLLREELVSDTLQTAVDRSVTNSVFSQKRSQGVEFAYSEDSFRGKFMVNDGINALNTRYSSSKEADIGLTARAEFKWGEGDWKRFDDFAGFRGQSYVGMFGAAIHWQHAGNTASPDSPPTSPVAQTDSILYTADLSAEGDGWNVFAEFIGSHFEPDESASSDSTDDFGVVVQGGFLFSDHDELFARWDVVFPDSDRAKNDDFHSLTFGWNHYFIPESHALKFTTDLSWHLNEVSENELVSKQVNGTSGLLTDSEDNQILLRFQMQLMF